MNSNLSGVRPVVGGRALSVGDDGRVLVDGRDPAAGDGIARGLARLVVDDVRADASEQGIAVDQTNTSVIVDERFVVKLVGRWAAADRAGRLLERLAQAGSEDVARLHGIVEWEHPERGRAALAIVTEYLPGAEDGWTWAVDDVLAHLDGAPDPVWPAILGAQVARMHDILGTDALPAVAAAGRGASASERIETSRVALETGSPGLDTRPRPSVAPRPADGDTDAGPSAGRGASASERIETSRVALETGSPGLDTRPRPSVATRPPDGDTDAGPSAGRGASASECIETSRAALEAGSPGLDTRPRPSVATRPAEGEPGVARPAADETAVRVANRRAALARAIRLLDDAAPGLVFPIHGDLHVGQILAWGDPRRYTIIDFDGDPQAEPADRDRPDAAARDVAHLLVSFDLVAAVVQKRLQRAEPVAWAWADRARADFLEAYRAALVRADLFDETLLPGFEAEQLVAELAYADGFLPRWRYAPDAAITHRYASSGEQSEIPWAPPPLESPEPA